MGTLADKLALALDTKERLKAALIAKGQTVADDEPFSAYPDKVLAIETGDGTITMERLEIATPPDKLDYYYNGLWHEFFDPTGMTFTLHVDLVGMKLTLPIRPVYEALDQDRHRMLYTVRPEAPAGMTNWPEVDLEITPDRQVEEGDTQITAEVRWHGQQVRATQTINVAYASPHWYDIEKKPRTWGEFAAEFGTWGGVESA